jgi:hypothetical protein
VQAQTELHQFSEDSQQATMFEEEEKVLYNHLECVK